MSSTKKEKLKQKIVQESYQFFIYAVFLSLFFCSLYTYQRLILDEYSIHYFHYGYGIFQGLVLAKIILIGEVFHLGERYADRPLIFPTLYKAVIFSILVLIFSIVEHFIDGFLKGIHSEVIYHELIDKGKYLIFAKILVVFFVFIPFFAFIETGRVMGEGKLINLFFRKKPK